MKEINLENILLAKFGCNSKQQFLDNFSLEEAYCFLLEAMKLSCDLTLKLAAENADIKYSHSFRNESIYVVDEKSILNTINQIK